MGKSLYGGIHVTRISSVYQSHGTFDLSQRSHPLTSLMHGGLQVHLKTHNANLKSYKCNFYNKSIPGMFVLCLHMHE